MKNKNQFCRFCGSKIENLMCKKCKSISTQSDDSAINTNASFIDYSYNRYDNTPVFNIYLLWIKFTAYLFYSNTWYSCIFSILISPLIGAKPKLKFNYVEKLIDVGCGRGFFMRYLPKSWHVVGTDIVSYNENRSSILIGNFEEFDSSKKFTITRSSHSLEHSIKPKIFLKKLIEITEKDGIIIISSPNPVSFSRSIFGRYWVPINVKSHFCILNPLIVKKYLLENNCKIIYCGTYTLFSSSGSLIEFLRIKKFSGLLFVLFSILLLPLTIIELFLNKADSFIIYAKKI